MLRTVIALAIVLAGAVFLWWLDRPLIRYASVGNMRDCSVVQLLNLPTDDDVVVLGSSRVRRGVSPEVMIEASGGRFDKVYNLGRPGREIIRSYVTLRDLEAKGIIPKIAVVEMDIDTLRGETGRNWRWNQRNTGWVTYDDIVRHGSELDTGFLTSARAFHAKVTQGLVLNLSGAPHAASRFLEEPAPNVCFE